MNITALCAVITNLWEIFSLIGPLPQNHFGNSGIQGKKKRGPYSLYMSQNLNILSWIRNRPYKPGNPNSRGIPFSQNICIFLLLLFAAMMWLIWQAYSGSFIRNNRRGSPHIKYTFRQMAQDYFIEKYFAWNSWWILFSLHSLSVCYISWTSWIKWWI